MHIVRLLSRLMEMIHMMLYEEEVSGARWPERIYTRWPARCHVTCRPSSKRLPKHHPPTNTYYTHLLTKLVTLTSPLLPRLKAIKLISKRWNKIYYPLLTIAYLADPTA